MTQYLVEKNKYYTQYLDCDIYCRHGLIDEQECSLYHKLSREIEMLVEALRLKDVTRCLSTEKIGPRIFQFWNLFVLF